MSNWPLTFITAFAASTVECVEALTIVLAVGLTRGWRSPLYGAAAAVVALGVLVAAFGTVLTTRVPESALRLVVGGLILLFGMRWLHKAVLRSAGVVAMHDENAEFAETAALLGGAAAAPARRLDWVAFAVAFKGVLLEGVEVAFIVFAVGANSSVAVATAGGVAAMLAVAATGVAVRRPLVRVPENTLKYAVGIVLVSLGTFWAVEGMGGSWPLDAGSIPVLAALYWLASRLAVRLSAAAGSPLPRPAAP